MPIRATLAVLVSILSILPSLAFGWTINASAGTGGTISPKGTITVTGTAGTYRNFDVIPSSGYRVSRVSIDGNPQTLPPPTSSGSYPFTVTYNGSYSRSISASFLQQTYKLSITTFKEADANGWVTTVTTPAGLSLDRLPAGTGVRCTVTAASGSLIDSVSINGVDQALTRTDQMTLNLVMTQNITVAARFRIQHKVTASAGPDQVSVGNGPEWPVTLQGSGSTTSGTPLSFAWSIVGSPDGGNGVLESPATATTSFHATTPGVYTLGLTVTDGLGISASGTTAATIRWRAEAEAEYCVSCHVNRDPAIVSLYQSSRHLHTGPEHVASCQGCHNPTRTGAHYAVTRPIDSCIPCHSAATPELAEDFAGSPHQAQGITCLSCHGDHSVQGTYSVCETCHNGNTAPVPLPTIHTGVSTSMCVQCHNPHAADGGLTPEHFNNMTTGAYPASYVTSRIGCSQCHSSYGASVNKSIRHDWAASGMGDVNSPAWKSEDFKTMGSPSPVSPASSYAPTDCVRCHTATGYLNYTNDTDGRGIFRNISPWGDSDKSKEVLACTVCHTTLTSSGTRRRVGIPDQIDDSIRNVVTWYSYSTSRGKDRIVRKFTDRADSNICILCHTGRVSGANLKNLSASIDWSNTTFIDPHNMAAASVLFQGLPGDKTIGYEYRDAVAYIDNYSHANLDSTQGPCVTCHMSSRSKHRFSAVSSTTNKVIEAITSPSCFERGPTGGCHTAALDGPFMEGRRQGYLSSLTVIAILLENKGIYFNPGKSPFFFNDLASKVPVTNWGSADTMGAAFNLKLFSGEEGAWVHNSRHTRQLLYDTVDYLDDGSQNETVPATLETFADPVFKEKAKGFLLQDGNRL